jgi:signal transduction histidine kinase
MNLWTLLNPETLLKKTEPECRSLWYSDEHAHLKQSVTYAFVFLLFYPLFIWFDHIGNVGNELTLLTRILTTISNYVLFLVLKSNKNWSSFQIRCINQSCTALIIVSQTFINANVPNPSIFYYIPIIAIAGLVAGRINILYAALIYLLYTLSSLLTLIFLLKIKMNIAECLSQIWTFFFFLIVLHARRASDLQTFIQKFEDNQIRSTVMKGSNLNFLGEMAGNIAHEVSNPLAIILGFTQKLRREFPDRTDIAKIESHSTRIRDVIFSLKLFSSNPDDEPTVFCDLKDLVEETLVLWQERLKKQEVQLELNLSQALTRVQPTQVKRAFLNLLFNAFDAAIVQPKPRIRIETNRTQQWSVIRIEDNGAGIPLHLQYKLFQPFFSTKRKGSGVGLGLSSAHGLITAQKGSLTFERSATETIFTIKVPFVAG